MFVQKLVARAWRERDLPLPDQWVERARRAGTDLDSLREVTTWTDWWGVFVGWAEADGVGIVLPVEQVLDFFENELGGLVEKQKRKKWNE